MCVCAPRELTITPQGLQGAWRQKEQPGRYHILVSQPLVGLVNAVRLIVRRLQNVHCYVTRIYLSAHISQNRHYIRVTRQACRKRCRSVWTIHNFMFSNIHYIINIWFNGICFYIRNRRRNFLKKIIKLTFLIYSLQRYTAIPIIKFLMLQKFFFQNSPEILHSASWTFCLTDVDVWFRNIDTRFISCRYALQYFYWIYASTIFLINTSDAFYHSR